MQGARAEPLLPAGHGTGQHLKVHPRERCQRLLEPAPAPALGSWSGTLLTGAAWAGEEGTGQAPEPLAMPPAPGKVSIPGRGALGRLAALTPSPADTSVPGPPRPLSRSPTPSPALSQLLSHQPSCSQGSSPLLKAKRRDSAAAPPVSVPRQRPPPPAGLACPREQRAKGKAGTRSQRQRGQGRWKRGRSPPPIAVSGCLLGRRRTVWQRGVRAPSPGCGCPSGAAAPPAFGVGHTVRSELGRRRGGVLLVRLGVGGV